jgi:GMP synthase-like glutamine amidotransferase
VVGPMAAPEIGVCPIELTPAARRDSLFSALGRTIHGLQWHGAEVRRVPPGATVLASNGACAVQAFRAAPGAWGVQFHMEVLDSTVDKWAEVPEYSEDLERSGVMDADTLRQLVAARLPAMEQATAALAQRLVATVQARRSVRGGAGIGPP